MPATAIPLAALASGCVGDRGLDQRAGVGGERLELEGGGGVGGDVALGVADDACLQRGVEVDPVPVADDQLGRAAADVDHEHGLDRGPFGGGADVGQPGLLLAVEDPRREREPLAQLGDEGVAVVGVADGAGRDRIGLLDAGGVAGPDVLGDHPAGLLDRLRGQLPGEVDPAPEPGDPTLALEPIDAAVGDVGDEQAGRVGADVDHGDPGGAPWHGGGTLEMRAGPQRSPRRSARRMIRSSDQLPKRRVDPGPRRFERWCWGSSRR